MKRIILGILVTVFSVALFAGFTSNPATAAEPFEIQFLAGRSDSAEFALTHGLSTLINKHSKWLRAKVIETPGMLANYELVVKKPQMKANAIICGVTSGIQMFPKTKAEGGFSWGPYMDYRFVARMNETIHTFITLDPSIKSIKDLKGKRLADGRKVATRYLDNELIFKEAGIFDSIKITHGGTGSGINALRDGMVDAAVALGIGPVEPTTWIPLAPVQALMASKKTYFVSYDEEAFRSAMKKYGMGTSPVTFPAKSLGPDQAEPVVTKYDPLPLVVDKSMKDEAVYELLRIFDTHLRELDDFSATAKWIKREYLGTSGYETEKMYHPAAAKYFRDNGIPIRVNPW